MNPEPPLRYSTLSEAVAWLANETGREWTENELLDAAAGYRIALHAGAPLSAKADLMEVDLTTPGCFRLKSNLGWRMAKLYPIHIGQILTVGETETVHPEGETLNDQEYLFFSERVRVTREAVRVSDEALREIVRRRKDDKRQAWYAERAKAAAEKNAALTEPTALVHDARPLVATQATQRRRRDNLQRAIFDAWGKEMPANACASEVFDYLVRADDTGYIRGRDGDELIWENTSGGISRTPLHKLAERLTKYRAEYERSR